MGRSRWRLWVIALCAAVLSAPAFAGELDLSGGGWLYGVSGTLANQGDVLNLRSDLGLNGRTPAAVSLSYRPQSGWWPILSANFQRIAASGESVVTTTTRFGPLVFQQNSTLVSSVGVNDIDFSADVPFRLLGIDWAAGLMGKYLYGHAVVDDRTSNQRTDYRVDAFFPLPELQARARLLRWLDLDAEAAVIAYQGDRMSQWRVGATVHLGPLALRAGYQEKHVVTDADGYHLDARANGPRIDLVLAIP